MMPSTVGIWRAMARGVTNSAQNTENLEKVEESISALNGQISSMNLRIPLDHLYTLDDLDTHFLMQDHVRIRRQLKVGEDLSLAPQSSLNNGIR